MHLTRALRYLRFNAFVSARDPFSRRARKRRMHSFARLMGLREGLRVLDLGGQPQIWDSVSPQLEVTNLNLPGGVEPQIGGRHCFHYVDYPGRDDDPAGDSSDHLNFNVHGNIESRNDQQGSGGELASLPLALR